MRDRYQDMNVRGASALILYDAIIMSDLSEHAAFNDGGDDRSDCVMKVVDDRKRIGQHEPHSIQVGKSFRYKVLDIDFGSRVEETQGRISLAEIDRHEYDRQAVIHNSRLEMRKRDRLLDIGA